MTYYANRPIETERIEMMSTEFDQVFTELEAPDYPATCDQCGAEGTNASIEGHVCDESPASRAGERNEWRLEYYKRGTSEPWLFCVTLPSGAIIARTINEHDAKQIITEHNQHATLVEQRDRLLRLLRPVTSPTACYCAVMKDETCWHCEARELIATIEPETEVK